MAGDGTTLLGWRAHGPWGFDPPSFRQATVAQRQSVWWWARRPVGSSPAGRPNGRSSRRPATAAVPNTAEARALGGSIPPPSATPSARGRPDCRVEKWLLTGFIRPPRGFESRPCNHARRPAGAPHVAGWSSGYLAWSTARRPRVRIPSLPPEARRGSCSPHQPVKLAPHKSWGGRRVVQFHHDPPRQGKWTEWRRHPAATRVSVGSIPTLPSTQAPSLPTGRMPGFQPGDAGSTPAGVANTGDVAQPASAPDCLSGPCGFESHRPRHGPWPKR